jgi:cytochrome c peroxidase
VPHSTRFDRGAARRGEALFDGKACCAGCHMPPAFTDAGWNLHTGEEICADNFQANRAPTFRYRTTPLRGLAARTRGGFYSCFELGLSDEEKNDLVQYLRGR